MPEKDSSSSIKVLPAGGDDSPPQSSAAPSASLRFTALLANVDRALELIEAPESEGAEARVEIADALRQARELVLQLYEDHRRQRDAAGAGGGTAQRALPLRVLSIDDEPSIGRALRRGLREYDVVTLESAGEALERIGHGERFDLILCDMVMPKMSGADFYERLEAIAPEQARHVVILTGGVTSDRDQALLARLGDRVLFKPFEMQSIRALVRRQRRSP